MQILQPKPSKPNLPNQTYPTKPTKPTKPNLPNQTQPNQTYQTKPTTPKLLVKVVNAWVHSAFGNVLTLFKRGDSQIHVKSIFDMKLT